MLAAFYAISSSQRAARSPHFAPVIPIRIVRRIGGHDYLVDPIPLSDLRMEMDFRILCPKTKSQYTDYTAVEVLAGWELYKTKI